MNPYNLQSDQPLTQLLKQKGIKNWDEAVAFIEQLPYGRNAHRTNFSLVILEGKGTCSSKHAFLKSVADENQWLEMELYIGIYKMDAENTPRIKSVLQKHKIEYLPEAHCYLKVDGNYLDATSKDACFDQIKAVILDELIIAPFQVGDFKVNYHKSFLKNWLATQIRNIPLMKSGPFGNNHREFDRLIYNHENTKNCWSSGTF